MLVLQTCATTASSCSAERGPWGLIHTRQARYQLNYIPIQPHNFVLNYIFYPMPSKKQPQGSSPENCAIVALKKASEDFHTVTELSDLVVGIAAVADVQEWGVDSVPSTAGLHEAREFFLDDIYSTDPETSLSS